MKDIDFTIIEIEKNINKIKNDIKINKNWQKSLMHIYCLKSTIKENKQKDVAKQIDMASILIRHQENILKEYQQMYKEFKNKIKDNK